MAGTINCCWLAHQTLVATRVPFCLPLQRWTPHCLSQTSPRGRSSGSGGMLLMAATATAAASQLWPSAVWCIAKALTCWQPYCPSSASGTPMCRSVPAGKWPALPLNC